MEVSVEGCGASNAPLLSIVCFVESVPYKVPETSSSLYMDMEIYCGQWQSFIA